MRAERIDSSLHARFWSFNRQIDDAARHAFRVAKVDLRAGRSRRAEREAGGIPIPKGTWQRVTAATDKLGVKAPA